MRCFQPVDLLHHILLFKPFLWLLKKTKKAFCSKRLMVFKPVSCLDVFFRAYLYAAVPRLAAAKHSTICPHIPHTLWPCPNPRHPRASCPHLTPLGVGRPSASPSPSSPMASDTPGTHLREEGTCLTPAAGPGCSSGCLPHPSYFAAS